MNQQRVGDGSNAPVSEVNDILSQHFGAEDPVETPQEGAEENAAASDQEDYTPEDEELSLDEGQEGEEVTDEQDPDDSEVRTFTELAEALEMDPSDLYALTYPMPDDMEPATLSEMKDVFIQHKRGTLNGSEGAEALEQARQQLDQERQQMYQQVQMQTQMPEQVRQIDAALQNVQAAYANTNWAELEKVDPGDAALQRQKLNEAAQGLMGQRAQVLGTLQQQQQQQYAAFAQEQANELFKVHPEWKENPEQVTEAWNDVISYAKGFGITEQEMAGLPNGRIFNMLHAAAAQHKAATNAGGKIKKLTRRSAPALKASAIRQARKGKRTKLEQIIKRGTDSKDIRDQTVAVAALLNS